MISVDSNAVLALLSGNDALNERAQRAFVAAAKRRPLFLCGPVYVELAAIPDTAEWQLQSFLAKTGIEVDWRFEEAVWREAARASREWYGGRRRGVKLPRRVAADFLIGAHASMRKAELLTFDRRTFQSAFPKLKLVTLDETVN